MRILFIGGTGIISSACSELALQRGFSLTLLTRGKSSRPIPAGAEVIQADIHDPAAVGQALGNRTFDAVVDWIAFVPDQVRRDREIFRDRTGQYIFISSASAYRTPPSALPVRESCVLDNPHWEYSRNKIACEEVLVKAYREEKFPMTIVRPSHTYDKTLLPFDCGWTVVDRMVKNKPVVVHGDGTSLWTLTHHSDFAKGLVGLLGHPYAIGEAFHITSDEWLTWNQIYQTVGEALGVKPRLVHVPSPLIAAHDREWGDSLLGDKAHSMVFDNGKVKRLVPDFICTTAFHRGIREVLSWYQADLRRQVVDPRWDHLQEVLTSKMAGLAGA